MLWQQCLSSALLKIHGRTAKGIKEFFIGRLLSEAPSTKQINPWYIKTSLSSPNAHVNTKEQPRP